MIVPSSLSLLLTFLLHMGSQCHAQSPQYVTVTTALGDVRGQVRLVLNQNVNQFLGVPYAEPPLAERRFEKPVPVAAWTNTLDATDFGPSCPQEGRRWQRLGEDCLYLNIYVSANSSLAFSGQPQKPVMVWIHGGGFVEGAGRDVDGAVMAVRGDVVVVTLNYRLGLLGWLSTRDDVMPGNNGLWDQRMALQWVRDHVAAFGGDPRQITIFGQSGGGYSVGLHTLSPLNNGLFQRAIMQSGSALNQRTIALDPVGFAERFGHQLGCWGQTGGGFDSRLLVSCARQRSVADILRATALAAVRRTVAWILDVAPVIDGDLLPEDVQTLLGPRYRDLVPFWGIDVMAGTTTAEGSLVLSPLRPFQGPLRFRLADGIPTRVLRENITTALTRDYLQGSRNVSEALYSEYRSQAGDAEQGRQVVNLYGDMMFVSAAVDTLQRHARVTEGRRSHYQYLFSYTRPGTTPYPWFRGAGHGAEVGYLFGMSAVNYEEARLSIAMIDGWTNFAKFGTPNPPSRQPGTFQWPAYDLTTRAYTNLDLTLTSARDLYSSRMQFWLQTIPRLTRQATSLTSEPQGEVTTSNPLEGVVEGLLIRPTVSQEVTRPQLWTFGLSSGGTAMCFMGARSAWKIGSVVFLSLLGGLFLA